uniref:Uncharacterized protein n=1 Tax=Micrurus lemniscatus lemniscatus TaxID=129467 RepID=A0A2D4J145_MICLE
MAPSGQVGEGHLLWVKSTHLSSSYPPFQGPGNPPAPSPPLNRFQNSTFRHATLLLITPHGGKKLCMRTTFTFLHLEVGQDTYEMQTPAGLSKRVSQPPGMPPFPHWLMLS